jgi:hypothetical protein
MTEFIGGLIALAVFVAITLGLLYLGGWAVAEGVKAA